MAPLVVSWGWQSAIAGPSRFVDHHEWQGTRDLVAFLSVPAAIHFQQRNDWEIVRKAYHALAVDFETRIRQLTGLPSVYHRPTWFAQMVSASLPADRDVAALKEFRFSRF